MPSTLLNRIPQNTGKSRGCEAGAENDPHDFESCGQSDFKSRQGDLKLEKSRKHNVFPDSARPKSTPQINKVSAKCRKSVELRKASMPLSNFSFHLQSRGKLDGCLPLTSSYNQILHKENLSMATDYSFLTEEYPKTISADQLYRICKISKRKAKWLLENGYIPCQDTGKKTRRFKIRIEDVINYLTILETDPQAVSTPVGLFSSRSSHTNPIAQIDISGFQQYLYKIWSDEPDALTPKNICSLTGYGELAVRRWINAKRILSVKLPDTTIYVAKQWLIEFISVYTVQNPNKLSKINRQVAKQYLEQFQTRHLLDVPK